VELLILPKLSANPLPTAGGWNSISWKILNCKPGIGGGLESDVINAVLDVADLRKLNDDLRGAKVGVFE